METLVKTCTKKVFRTARLAADILMKDAELRHMLQRRPFMKTPGQETASGLCVGASCGKASGG